MIRKVKQNPRGRWFQQLTPEMAWKQYVGTSVELFVSNFIADGYNSVDEMCQKFARELPMIVDQLFAQNQLDHIAKLLSQYAQEYIAEKGGLDNLDLYSSDELEALFKEITFDLLNSLEIFKKPPK